MPILQFLLSLFASKPPALNPETPERATTIATTVTFSDPALGSMSAELDRAANLLLTPNPQSIRTVTAIMQDVSVRLGALSGPGLGEQARNELRSIEDQLRRTRRLVEGAMRIQWINLRRLLALTQSYAPPGRLSQFKDRWPRIDLKV